MGSATEARTPVALMAAGQTAVARGQVGALPDVGEQHVIGEVGEFRGVLADEIRGDARAGAGHERSIIRMPASLWVSPAAGGRALNRVS